MRNNKMVFVLTEIGLVVALAFILDLVKLWRVPQGGSITLAAVPLVILALRHGLGASLLAGGLLGTIKLLFGGYVVHPLQAILDYPLAFILLGLVGAFRKLYFKKDGAWWTISLAIFTGILGRFICHFLSGLLFFSQYAPEGMSLIWYTTIYNGIHLIPTMILTNIVVLFLTRYKRLLSLDL